MAQTCEISGVNASDTHAPCFNIAWFFKAFALTGRQCVTIITQGDALG